MSPMEVQKAQATFSRLEEMTCLARTGEGVGDGERPILYSTPIPVAGLQPQLPLCVFGLPSCVDFKMSPKVGARNAAHLGRPQPRFPPGPPQETLPLSPRGLGLVGAEPPSTHCGGAGAAESAHQTPARPRPRRGALGAYSGRSPELSRRCAILLGLPSRARLRQRPRMDEASPRPARPRPGPASSPLTPPLRLGRAPRRKVGKLPGGQGGGGWCREELLCPAPGPRSPHPLYDPHFPAPSPPPPSSHSRRELGEASNWTTPPLKKKKEFLTFPGLLGPPRSLQPQVCGPRLRTAGRPGAGPKAGRGRRPGPLRGAAGRTRPRRGQHLDSSLSRDLGSPTALRLLLLFFRSRPPSAAMDGDGDPGSRSRPDP